MSWLKKIGVGVGIFIVIIFVIGIISISQLTSDVSESTDTLPLGTPETQIQEFELTDNEKTKLRAIELGCKEQIDMAFLVSESTAQIVKQQCNQKIEQTLNEFKNSRIITQALEYDDVTICKNSPYVDNCVTTYALEQNDYQACQTLNNNTLCVIKFGKKFLNAEVCLSSINPQYCLQEMVQVVGTDACYMMYDSYVEDCKKNYLISQFDNKNTFFDDSLTELRCTSNPPFSSRGLFINACKLEKMDLKGITIQNLLNWQHDGEPIVCDIFNIPFWMNDNEKTNFCIASIAVYAKNVSLCDKTANMRGECYGVIANTDDRVTLNICDTLSEGGKAFCYMNVAIRTKDSHLCSLNQIRDYDMEKNCLDGIEARQRWESFNKI